MKETNSIWRLTANRKLTLFTLFALPTLIALGCWQWSRAAEKRVLEASYTAQQTQPPIALDANNITTLADYRRVFVQGEFDHKHTWLLDNKQREGRVGYEVVVPFVLDDGSMMLVNRGWLAGSGDRQHPPLVPTDAGPQTLFGILVSATKHPLLNANHTGASWPRIIMAIDPPAMAQQLDQPLLERYLLLDEGSPGALVTNWPVVNVSSAKHLGYAFQWFGMALALVIWFIVANTAVLRRWRGHN
jgi:surfeit locus 1 family protein